MGVTLLHSGLFRQIPERLRNSIRYVGTQADAPSIALFLRKSDAFFSSLVVAKVVCADFSLPFVGACLSIPVGLKFRDAVFVSYKFPRPRRSPSSAYCSRLFRRAFHLGSNLKLFLTCQGCRKLRFRPFSCISTFWPTSVCCARSPFPKSDFAVRKQRPFRSSQVALVRLLGRRGGSAAPQRRPFCVKHAAFFSSSAFCLLTDDPFCLRPGSGIALPKKGPFCSEEVALFRFLTISPPKGRPRVVTKNRFFAPKNGVPCAVRKPHVCVRLLREDPLVIYENRYRGQQRRQQLFAQTQPVYSTKEAKFFGLPPRCLLKNRHILVLKKATLRRT